MDVAHRCPGQPARPICVRRVGQHRGAPGVLEARDRRRRDSAQVITWSDYSEMTSFAPSVSHGYAFLDISAYYQTRFQTGSYPAIAGCGLRHPPDPAVFREAEICPPVGGLVGR